MPGAHQRSHLTTSARSDVRSASGLLSYSSPCGLRGRRPLLNPEGDLRCLTRCTVLARPTTKASPGTVTSPNSGDGEKVKARTHPAPRRYQGCSLCPRLELTCACSATTRRDSSTEHPTLGRTHRLGSAEFEGPCHLHADVWPWSGGRVRTRRVSLGLKGVWLLIHARAEGGHEYSWTGRYRKVRRSPKIRRTSRCLAKGTGLGVGGGGQDVKKEHEQK